MKNWIWSDGPVSWSCVVTASFHALVAVARGWLIAVAAAPRGFVATLSVTSAAAAGATCGWFTTDVARFSKAIVTMVASQMAPQSTRRDLSAITAEWQRKLALRQQRIERALAGFAGQVAHVDFDRLNADWEAEIGHVYAALDMPLSGAALAAMRREQRKAAAGSHTAHKVQIENFAAGEAA